MYLNLFGKEQKELALDLLIYTAMANDEMEDAEKMKILEYCKEMGIKETRYSPVLSLQESEQKFLASSSDSEIKMMLVEIIALAMSDNKVDEKEKDFVKAFMEKAAVSRETMGEILQILKTISYMYENLNSIVFTKS